MDNVKENRDKYIGGSDLPRIMSESNLYKFALEKLNPTFEGNEYTYYGQFMEPIIREYVNQQYDYNFAPDTLFKGIYRANCDGICPKSNKLLEVKTHGSNIDVMKYISQIQGYLNLYEINHCILASYERPVNFFTWGDITDRQSYNLEFDLTRLEIFYIFRDKQMWTKIDKKASKFFKGLQALRKNPNLTEREFNILVYGKTFVEAVESYQGTKYLENFCRSKNISRVQIGDITLSCSEVTEISVDSKKLADDLPNIFEKYKVSKKTTQLKLRRKNNVTN
jgi:predicted phage-related endonuclease